MVLLSTSRSVVESSEVMSHINDDDSMAGSNNPGPIDDIQQSIMKAERAMKNKQKKQRKKLKKIQ